MAQDVITRFKADLDAFKKDLKEVKTGVKDLDKDAKKTSKGIDKNFKSAEKSAQSLGNTFKTIGKNLVGFFAVGAIFAGISKAVRGAIDTIREFDESIADIQKTTGLSADAARELSKSLLEIDTRTGVTELQQLATAAGRLGIEGEDNIRDFVEQADKSFVALGDDLGGSAEEIATNLGRIGTTFQLEKEFGIGESLNKIGSTLNELGATTKANAGFIQEFTKRLSGVAPAAGITFQEVAGLGAVLQEFGQTSEVSATTLNQLIPALGKDIPKFAKVAGLSIEEFSGLLKDNANEALLQVLEGAKSTETGVQGLAETLTALGVDGARAAGVVGVLSQNIDRVREVQETANRAFEEGTSLTDEFNIKNETLNAQLEKVSNNFDAVVLSIEDGSGGISQALNTIIAGFNESLSATARVQSGTETLTDEYGTFTGRLAQVASLFNSGLTPALDQVVQAQKRLDDAVRNFTDKTLENFNKATREQQLLLIQGIKLRVQEIVVIQLLEGELNKQQQTQLEGLTQLVRGIQESQKARAEANVEVEETIDLGSRTVSAIEAEIKAQKDLLKQATTRAQTIPIRKEINRLESELAAILGDQTKAQKDATKAAEDAEKARLKALDDEFNAILKQAEKELVQAAKTEEDIAKRRNEIREELRERGLQEVLDNEDAELDLKIEKLEEERTRRLDIIDKTIADEEQAALERALINQDINDEIANQNKIAADAEEDRLKALNELRKELALDAADFVFQLFLQGLDRQAEALQEEFDARQARIDAAAENRLATEEQTEEATRVLAERREKAEADARRKRAVAEKVQALFNAGLAGGEAIIKSLTALPLVAVGGLAALLATSAIVALRLAAIAASPIPSFAKGVIGLQGPGTETSDSITARLSKNESVMTAQETKNYRSELEAMRGGKATFENLMLAKYIAPALRDEMANIDRKNAINIQLSQMYDDKRMRRIGNKGNAIAVANYKLTKQLANQADSRRQFS